MLEKREIVIISRTITNVEEDAEKKKPSYTAGRTANWYSHYGKQYGGSSKTKNWSTIGSSNPSTGYLPQRLKNIYPKRYLPVDADSSSILSGQDMEATKVSYDRWLVKEAMVHIYNGILLRQKKRWNTVIATTWMDLEIIMLSKISQTEKVEHHTISLICGI